MNSGEAPKKLGKLRLDGMIFSMGNFRKLLPVLMLLVTISIGFGATADGAFPPPLESYGDNQVSSVWSKLVGRVQASPFNLVATAIFFLAIIHTFLASQFTRIAHRLEHRMHEMREDEWGKKDSLKFRATVFHFLGEVEVVFGLWLIPLIGALALFYDWGTAVRYLDGVNYGEAVFVFVVMAVSSSKPILLLAERLLAQIARLGGGSPWAWWLSILTVGPLLGSFITEPAAMTICALLLVKRFYAFKPGLALKYATLALLFVNVSVGGTLSHFAAPPVVMVATKWDWSLIFMLSNFGWKAALAIAVTNFLFFLWFRKELLELQPGSEEENEEAPRIPLFVTVVHILTIGWVVLNAHHVAMVVFGLLFFLGFVVATGRHQSAVNLRSPMLVGFFLAALVVHGGCQQWWIAPVLGSLSEWPLMIGATLLTAVNDNAAITYLATLVPGLDDSLKYAVVAGAVTGGGLTVIANAPNPAGQSILQSQFGSNGINPLGLFAAAIMPTILMGAAFMLLP
jgi:Na+/H+ antiporter NhaD/arsenite permease-like protein